MVEQLNGLIRQAIDAFTKREIETPIRVGVGSQYMVPGDTQPWYLVAEVQYTHDGHIYRGFICSCKAYHFGHKGETCKHIEQIDGQGSVKGRWTPGRSTKSPTPSGSKQEPRKPRAARSSSRSVGATNKGSTGSSSRKAKLSSSKS